MGLLDDMAKATKDMHTKPDGWMTVKEFSEASGMSLSKSKRVLDEQVAIGALETRTWRSDGFNGRPSAIYGEPAKTKPKSKRRK